MTAIREITRLHDLEPRPPPTTCLMVVALELLIERDGLQGASYWLSRCAEVLLGDEPEAGTH